MSISIATMGKFEYIKGTPNAAYRLGIGGEGGGTGGPKKKPQVVISQVITEQKDAEFEIYKIEEEIIW